MPDYTSKVGLVKPAGGELISIDILNGNSDKIDKALGVFICTSTTRPSGSDRFPGQQIYETNTHKMYFWNGTAWLFMEKATEVEFYTGSFPITTVTSSLKIADLTGPSTATYSRRFQLRAQVTIGGTATTRQVGDIVVSQGTSAASTYAGSQRVRVDTANLSGDYTTTHFIDYIGSLAANEVPLFRLWWDRIIGTGARDIQAAPSTYSKFDVTLWPY